MPSALQALARAVRASIGEWEDFCADSLDRACNAVQPDATPRNRVPPNPPVVKTKPPSDAAMSTAAPDGSRLTPRQLAAARLIAFGRSIPEAAAELKIARTTVWRWQRSREFRDELDRIHARLILAGASAGRAERDRR